MYKEISDKYRTNIEIACYRMRFLDTGFENQKRTTFIY